MENKENTVDAAGTTQAEAKELLENLYENGFSSSLGSLAVALGRDKEDLQNILDGEKTIDDDLAMKVRGIARERNIEIE